MAARLDAAMGLLDLGERIDLIGGSGVEIELDLGMGGLLIVLGGQQIVAAEIDDRLGDVGLAAHGVDGDEAARKRSGRGQFLQQQGNGGDLVGFVGHRPLPQHEAVGCRIGRDEMQRRLSAPAIVAARARSCHRWRSGRPLRADARRRKPESRRRTGPARSGSSPPAASRRRECRNGRAADAAESRDACSPTERCRRSRRRPPSCRTPPEAAPRRADTSPCIHTQIAMGTPCASTPGGSGNGRASPARMARGDEQQCRGVEEIVGCRTARRRTLRENRAPNRGRRAGRAARPSLPD